MGKREKRILTTTVTLMTIVVLLLVSNSFGQKERKIYRIPVYISEDNPDYWEAFRYGIDRAGYDYNVDTRIAIVNPGTDDLETLREILDEADAVVLAAPPRSLTSLALDLTNSGIPIIAIGDSTGYQGKYIRVGADEYLIGQAIGQQAEQSGISNLGVIVFSDNTREKSMRLAGLIDYLTAHSITHTVAAYTGTYSILDQINSSPSRLLVGLESIIVENLCDFVQNNLANKKYQVIGADYSGKTLYALEEGIALCLVVQNQFELGYMAIERAVSSLSNRNTKSFQSKLYIATRQNMHNELAPVLYPLF